MSRLLFLAMLLAAAAACSNQESLGTADESNDMADSDVGAGEEAPEALAAFTFELDPADDVSLVPTAVLGPFYTPGNYDLAVRPAAIVQGTVTARRTVPLNFLPTLPTELASPSAEVILIERATGRQTFTATDDAGGFSLAAPAPAVYDMLVLPDDAAVPVQESLLVLTNDTVVDLDLNEAAPVWGRVSTPEGAPVSDARVSIVGSSGIVASTTRTDEQGDYALHAEPGVWTLLVDDAYGGTSPMLNLGSTTLPAEGVQLNAELPVPDNGTLRGRLVREGGGPATGIAVEIASTGFESYDERASLHRTVLTDSNGNFQTGLPSGTYDVQVAPDTSRNLSPLALSNVAVDASSTNVGELVLTNFRTVSVGLVASKGQPVSRATLLCQETLGAERFWLGYADDVGQVTIEVPDTELDCLVVPPSDRPDLATYRVVFDSQSAPEVIVMPEGDLMSGSVRLLDLDVPEEDLFTQGEPLALTTVRMRDAEGRIWATTISDEDGNWSFRVDWNSATRDAAARDEKTAVPDDLPQ